MKYENNTIKISKIFIFCIVFFLAIFAIKLGYIGFATNVEGTNLADLALSRRTQTDKITASRGNILDIDGNILANNVNSYTLIAYLEASRTTDDRYPKHVIDKELTARKLSEVLLPLNKTMTYEYILSRLNSVGKYQVEFGTGGKDLSELTKQKIDALALPGIDFSSTLKRYYPYGDFASYIIGYAKKDTDTNKFKGELGIEGFADHFLTGTDGEVVYQKDRYGYKLADHVSYTTKEVQNGYDVYLTIDSQIQMFLDNAITQFMKYTPSWVSLSVADADTGAIIGSSSNPSFNPNLLNITNYNNPLLSYAYEPGSTMKIFSFMSAIEEGIYDGNSLYKSGEITIDDYTIHDWNKKGWGKITYDTGFTYSSNIAAVNLAQKLGKNKLSDYYSRLGLGKKTGIELANEYSGDISIEYNTELATASYGQGIMATPIQIIQALTSITNNGTTLKPYIIDHIVDPDTNEVVYTGKKTELNKVWSEPTISKIKDLMDLTVNGSDTGATGRVYQVDSVRLIGKTGTSYYVEPGEKTYASGTYKNIRSFAGIFPKDQPEYIIYAVVKDFHGTSKEMGAIISNLVESISKYKNLDERESDIDYSRIITIPSVLNNQTETAINKLSAIGASVVTIGNGDKVIKQYPSKDSKVVINSHVFILTNAGDITLPDLTGWSRKEVNDLCNLANIKCNLIGYGYVSSVNLPVGSIINDEVTLEVNLTATKPVSLTKEEGQNEKS